MQRIDKGISHSWSIVIWFFYGAALSLIAFDLSDYLNYAAQASGTPLTAIQQVLYYAILPTALYLGLAFVAFILAKTHLLTPYHFVEAFLILVVIVPAILGYTLPQSQNLVFDLTIGLGTIMSVVIGLGLIHKVKR